MHYRNKDRFIGNRFLDLRRINRPEFIDPTTVTLNPRFSSALHGSPTA